MAEPVDWMTINGVHIPIFEGDSKIGAMKRFYDSKHGKSIMNLKNYNKSKSMTKKDSNIATGAKSEKSINQLYKLDEQLKDLEDEDNEKPRMKKPSTYSQRKKNHFNKITKAHNKEELMKLVNNPIRNKYTLKSK